MSLEAFFHPYPDLKTTFWPAADKIKDDKNPLLILLRGTDERSKSVATHTNYGCREAAKAYPSWLEAKAKIILTNGDIKNAAATLAEIRALGELRWAWQSNVKPGGNAGHDFFILGKSETIRIEVYAQQPVAGKIEHEANRRGNIVTQISEVAVFDYPKPGQKINVQGQATRKLSQAKAEEHQLVETDINILWCDLTGIMAPFDFDVCQFKPLSNFRESISSGCFWNAYYATKGTPIYDGLSINGGYGRKVYDMEFEGRFWRGSIIDFVIANTVNNQVIFQNFNRLKPIPDWLFCDLHRLRAFNLAASWLDWPCRNTLKTRVETALQTIRGYRTVFNED